MRANATAKWTEVELFIRSRYKQGKVSIKPIKQFKRATVSVHISLDDDIQLILDTYKTAIIGLGQYSRSGMDILIRDKEALGLARGALDDLIYGGWRGFVDEWEESLNVAQS